MIDQHFQKAISQLGKRRDFLNRRQIRSFAFSAGCFVLGGLLVVPFASKFQMQISDDELGRLAAIAACSTGQSPAVEWEKALDNVSFMDWLKGQSNLAAASYFLSVIDTDRCGRTNTSRA
ncbi:hypothetical protein [uncultured Roseibium sp.]|uniref:hypothetical protein n=1 Tax=uncultured Roseibium sp. TaxID=1936171 RepID=UPI0026249738|nr:hypothetical protein [uncultured Roseibium sp.]